MLEPHRWNVRVSTRGREIASVFARTHRFEVGLPLSFDADYGEVTALEHVLGALGADLCCGLAKLARTRRLAVDDIEAVVHAELENPLAHLAVVGEEGSPAMKKVSIKVYLGSLEDDAQLNALWRDVLARSPLIQTFERAVELELELRVVM